MKGTVRKMILGFDGKAMFQLVIISITLVFIIKFTSVSYEDSKKISFWMLTVATYALVLNTSLNLKSSTYRKKHIDLLEGQIELLREQNTLIKNGNSIASLSSENQTGNEKETNIT